MRKVLFAAVAASVLVPTMVSAQSAREVRHDQREVHRDIAKGNYKEAREDQRELREDWRDYRKAHRNVYHRKAYVAPRGMRYKAVRTGAQLNRAFYAKPYWVSNYSTYRLPRPGNNLTYVRYGNDVLLVNTRTGRVVQVYNGFFW